MWMCIFAILLWFLIKGDLEVGGGGRDLYLSGNFETVCREMASNTKKWPSPGAHRVSSWVWIQQLVIVFCWLPGCSWALHMETCHHFCHGLGTSGASLPVRAWSKQTREQLARFCGQYPGAPCCCLWWDPFFAPPSWWRSSGSDAPSLVRAGAGTALFYSEQHQGCPLPWQRYARTGAVTPLDQHFLKELGQPRVAVRSLNALQPHVHRFDSDASPPTSLELLQLYRSAKESPIKLITFKAKRLGYIYLPRAGESWSRLEKKKMSSHKSPPACAAGGGRRWGQTFPTPPWRTRLAQVIQRLACAWKSHPHFRLQVAGGSTRIKAKWNVLFF